ncbi:MULTISPECIES: FadR/GntR family transcriptional regulator [unclassified Achromobacter]|uniref:FadR/GntR family transcriptional regulator n=1 Tax=unclassified Achromobacter TaxID=2626865 RepID=UPI001303ED74|nr:MULTISPECIES: FCD domain-containing protein [unclassified Achromobacter]
MSRASLQGRYSALRAEPPIARAATLPAEVAERLRGAIGRRDIVDEDNKLPSEAELAQVYGVSRPVIREAMSLLKAEGLVIAHQGRGQFVNPAGSNVFRLEPNVESSEDLRELFEFLLSVEVPATRLAAERRDPQGLQAIQQAYARLYEVTNRGVGGAVAGDLADAGADAAPGGVGERRPGNEPADGADEDGEFHRAIVAASGNRYFMAFSDFLDARVRRMIRLARKNTRTRSAEWVWQVQQEHEAILRAIEAGDPDAASHAAAAHLNNAAARLALYQQDQG